ncbi:MAG: DUF111 family protein [Deltaproteobacteria bacterium]|nr:DUF111 family protein [Deltaproteobacteria bacterium]
MKWKTETITLLETQLDDITGQQVGYLIKKLLDAGALDAICIPVLMKKGRPGFLFQVLCRHKDKNKFCEFLFDETPTLGIRFQKISRVILPRKKTILPIGRLKAKSHIWRGKVITVPEFDEVFRKR